MRMNCPISSGLTNCIRVGGEKSLLHLVIVVTIVLCYLLINITVEHIAMWICQSRINRLRWSHDTWNTHSLQRPHLTQLLTHRSIKLSLDVRILRSPCPFRKTVIQISRSVIRQWRSESLSGFTTSTWKLGKSSGWMCWMGNELLNWLFDYIWMVQEHSYTARFSTYHSPIFRVSFTLRGTECWIVDARWFKRRFDSTTQVEKSSPCRLTCDCAIWASSHQSFNALSYHRLARPHNSGARTPAILMHGWCPCPGLESCRWLRIYTIGSIANFPKSANQTSYCTFTD